MRVREGAKNGLRAGWGWRYRREGRGGGREAGEKGGEAGVKQGPALSLFKGQLSLSLRASSLSL
jgi:hypothetical protein